MAEPLNTGMLKINNVSVIDPSRLEPARQFVHAEDSGRDERGTMHVIIVAMKRTWDVEWAMIDPDYAQIIINAVEASPTFPVEIYDEATKTIQKYTCYVGDRNLSVQQWIPNRIDGKLYGKLAFRLIEV